MLPKNIFTNFAIMFLMPLGLVFAKDLPLNVPVRQKPVSQVNNSEQLQIISEVRAKRQAEKIYGGKALSAQLSDSDDILYYRVKLIKKGRIKIVWIIAER